MRPAFHTGLILALLVSFGQAPTDHFHPADPDHGHGHDHHERAHAVELFHDSDHEPGLEAPDHDSTAKLKDWLAGDGSAPSKMSAEFVSAANTEKFVVVQRSLAAVTPRNHDPPSVRKQPARAPPAHYSL